MFNLCYKPFSCCLLLPLSNVSGRGRPCLPYSCSNFKQIINGSASLSCTHFPLCWREKWWRSWAWQRASRLLSIFRAVIHLRPHFPLVPVWLRLPPSYVTFTLYSSKITIQFLRPILSLPVPLCWLAVYLLSINPHHKHRGSVAESPSFRGRAAHQSVLSISNTNYYYYCGIF